MGQKSTLLRVQSFRRLRNPSGSATTSLQTTIKDNPLFIGQLTCCATGNSIATLPVYCRLFWLEKCQIIDIYKVLNNIAKQWNIRPVAIAVNNNNKDCMQFVNTLFTGSANQPMFKN
ncbi:hypothetical protein T03_9859 [Trichinella britovi]|uniref:Uncharacterized protein n=1 Tax=Trichinella britovi TaxID=45882 RepID=A0A0V1CVM3_TRIBR|nr:hypothetical protein T03_9859 [Trichinella britovi]